MPARAAPIAATPPTRRTQAERRASTRAAVLDSACRLFGTKGYTETSLEEIASACGLTIRPIYHYFGNKLALFQAVNAVMEERIVASMLDPASITGENQAQATWRAFLELCRDPKFRQIVLIDAPNVLGRARWAEGSVWQTAGTLLRRRTRAASNEAGELVNRVLMAAMTEAALSIAESHDPKRTSAAADDLVPKLLDALSDTPNR
jgi:AcrR family transcriptional regulator